MIDRLLHALFAPRRTAVVPLLRVVMVLWVMWFRFGGSTQRVRRAFSRHPHELFEAPHLEAVLDAVGLWPLPGWLVDHLDGFLLFTGALVVLGIATRVSLLACFGAFFIVTAVSTGWGFFNHTPALPAQLMLALVFLPGTTSFTVDRLLLALWRRRRGDARPLLDTVWPAVPGFGELGVVVVVGLMYGASGIAKLRAGAWGWFNGETLRWYLQGSASKAQYWYGPIGSTDISGHHYMGQSPALARLLASSTVAVLVLSWLTLATELFAIVFLVLGRWWRVGWVAVAVVFHIGVLLTLAPRFNDWIMVDVCLVVPFLVERWQARGAQRALGGRAPVTR